MEHRVWLFPERLVGGWLRHLACGPGERNTTEVGLWPGGSERSTPEAFQNRLGPLGQRAGAAREVFGPVRTEPGHAVEHAFNFVGRVCILQNGSKAIDQFLKVLDR